VSITDTITATGAAGKTASATVALTATVTATGTAAVGVVVQLSRDVVTLQPYATITASGVLHGTHYVFTPGTYNYNEALDHPGSSRTIFVKDNYLHVGTTVLRINGAYVQTDNARDEDMAAAT